MFFFSTTSLQLIYLFASGGVHPQLLFIFLEYYSYKVVLAGTRLVLLVDGIQSVEHFPPINPLNLPVTECILKVLRSFCSTPSMGRRGSNLSAFQEQQQGSWVLVLVLVVQGSWLIQHHAQVKPKWSSHLSASLTTADSSFAHDTYRVTGKSLTIQQCH